MGISHISGPLVQGTDLRPASSTNIFTQRAVFVAGASVTGQFYPGLTSFTFVSGAVRKMSAGTYIGFGGATAPITVVGATIRQVIMQRRLGSYPAAGTLDARGGICRPCKAAGTPGSFYPRVFRTGATNKEVYAGNGSSATWQWIAVCG